MSEDNKIDYAEVMRRLPHRYPFLLVDKAEDFVTATSIVGIKNVTHNEPFFPGHFPIDPVMPGVLLLAIGARRGAGFALACLAAGLLVPVIAVLAPIGQWVGFAQRLAFALWFGWWLFAASRASVSSQGSSTTAGR